MRNSDTNNCSACNLCFARADSVFSVLTVDELYELEIAKNYISYSDGELIFKEKQRPFGIYIIQEGQVKVSKYGFEGREYIVRFAKKGNIIGYRSFFSNDNYSCSATAISETQVCFISGEVILNLITKNAKLGIQFMKHLANDLKAAEDKAISIAQKPARERIAESIIILKDIYGYEQEGYVINISLKRDEIASIAGTSRETVVRILSEYSDEKILHLSGRKIQILDIKRLITNANKSF